MEKIGLIAGKSRFPEIFRELAEKKGYKVVSVGIEGITDIETDETVKIGQIGKLIKFFRREGVKNLVMLGKFEHRLIYSDILSFDFKVLSILKKLKDRKPETLIKAFMELMKEEGFEFMDPKPILDEILADRGVITKKKPSKEAMEDGLWGFNIAKEIASMDIGQTIVVKDKAVIAVEAMEGTQETILRGGKIGGKGTRVIKVARRKQDFRIDVPAVGTETLEAMKSVKADTLFLEAGKVYIIEKEKFLRLADLYGISVVGI